MGDKNKGKKIDLLDVDYTVVGKRRAQEVNTQNLRDHWVRKEGPHDYVIL